MNHDGYLINYHPDKEDSPTLNIDFFKDYLYWVIYNSFLCYKLLLLI